MFTGLVSELGKIQNMQKTGKSLYLTISAQKVIVDLKIGDSIAVNGTCVTVVQMTSESFCVDVMPQTSTNTIMLKLKLGEMVNLERTLKLSDRLDGHIVSGHVDSVGRIVDVKKDEIANIFKIQAEKQTLKYIVLKGSVAIDGISLTVCDVKEDNFSISIIPHTAKNTTLGWKKQGDLVNIETDILGKYVEKLLMPNKNGIDINYLLEKGF